MTMLKQSGAPVGQTTRGFSFAVLVAAVIALGATLWHVLAFTNTDIAWLLTVGEHILDGAKPYADIIETNPPGSILLYMPAIWLARLIGAAPEPLVMLLTAFGGVLTLALSAAILRESTALAVEARGPALIAATIVLMLLPAGSFGQREHVIVLLLLPLLCRIVARQTNAGHLSLGAGLLAAIGAGVGVAIKPYYCLGLVGPILLFWRRGGWRGARSAWEVWLACALAMVLGLAQIAAFPEFSGRILPLLARIYVPARLPLSMLLVSPGALLEWFSLLAYAAIRVKGATRPLGDAAIAASAGFFIAYLIQAKGWPYHAYPAVAASLLALASVLSGPSSVTWPNGVRLQICRAAAGLLVMAGSLWFDTHLDVRTQAPGLESALVALGPHPRVMSLDSDIAVGHPLVREIGGRWVGTLMSSWISRSIERMGGSPDLDGPYGNELALEQQAMVSDIRTRKPDAILASLRGWSDWIARKPELQGALAEYHLSGTFGPVMLWTRKDGLPTS